MAEIVEASFTDWKRGLQLLSRAPKHYKRAFEHAHIVALLRLCLQQATPAAAVAAVDGYLAAQSRPGTADTLVLAVVLEDIRLMILASSPRARYEVFVRGTPHG